MECVFRWLSVQEVAKAGRVCKKWSKIIAWDPFLLDGPRRFGKRAKKGIFWITTPSPRRQGVWGLMGLVEVIVCGINYYKYTDTLVLE